MSGETGLFKTGELKQQPKSVEIKKLFADAEVLAPTIPMYILIRGMLDEVQFSSQWGVEDFASFQKRITVVFGDTNSSQVDQLYKVIHHIFEKWDIDPILKTQLLSAAHQGGHFVSSMALRSPAPNSFAFKGKQSD